VFLVMNSNGVCSISSGNVKLAHRDDDDDGQVVH
jgi:hypothetical protein